MLQGLQLYFLRQGCQVDMRPHAFCCDACHKVSEYYPLISAACLMHFTAALKELLHTLLFGIA